jgi:cation:H+ antiporter
LTVQILGILASLAILTIAGDQFVVGLARLSAMLRVRATVVGVLIAGAGTSLSELVVAGVATHQGRPTIALGSLVGSIVVAMSLALGCASLVFPIRVGSLTVRREAPLAVSAVTLFGLLSFGGVTPWKAVVLAVALVVVVTLLVMGASHAAAIDELAAETEEFFSVTSHRSRLAESFRSLVSLAAMVGGALLLVQSASGLALRMGLAQGFVGLSIVALGTDAPLIASSIQAARRGEHDLVVGTVLGESMFLALAGGALVGFLGGSAGTIAPVALWAMIAVAVASWAFMARGGRITRPEAVGLLLAYFVMLVLVAR